MMVGGKFTSKTNLGGTTTYTYEKASNEMPLLQNTVPMETEKYLLLIN